MNPGLDDAGARQTAAIPPRSHVQPGSPTDSPASRTGPNTATLFAAAFALSNLYLLYLTGPLISPEHQLIFHLPGSATPLFEAVLLNLVLCTMLVWLPLRTTGRRPAAHVVVWAALLLPLPCVLVHTIADFMGRPAPALLVAGTALLGVGLWLAVLTRRQAWAPVFTRLLPALTTSLSFVALSGLLILGQLLWLGWRTRAMDASFVPRGAQGPAASALSGRRVVWIILDELSFRQVYGHRYPHLRLPNFDQLASESVLFPNAEAAGQYTRIALPSLLTGTPMSATEPAADGRHLLLHPRGAAHWQPFHAEDTVFGDAAGAGLATGIAGWYEPYCRVFSGALDHCFWSYRDSLPGGMSPDLPVGRNLLEPWREGLLRLLHLVGVGPGVPAEGTLDVERHAADMHDLVVAGDRLLTEQHAGLILLHMPVPHPWGFFDRRSGSYPAHRTSYLDNLALADAYLGHVRALLEAQGTWDTTDVVIMGDHGWRVWNVWRPSGFWTDEDQRASEGTAPVDAPAVLVKLHGQRVGVVSAARFQAVRTRSLIGALLHRRISDSAGLLRWVDAAAR